MSKTIAGRWIEPGTRQTVSVGIAVADALPEAIRRLSISTVALVTTNSLTGAGGLADHVRQILGPKFHSLTSDIRQHSSRSQALRVAEAISGADGVISLGGGSVCDSVKAARLCLANRVTDIGGFDGFRTHHMRKDGDLTKSPTIPFVAIPTTLSAAEFTDGVGIVDERVSVKQVIQYPNINPDIVVLDPAMTVPTPSRLLYATGIRAIDHAVESWCSINANGMSSSQSLYAARLLFKGLAEVKAEPTATQPRVDCQQGAWLSVLPAISGVKSGASHGFGQALGTICGIPHGEAGCVMLPHILRFNEPVNELRQRELVHAVGHPEYSLAENVAQLVATLGLPSRLRDLGIDEIMLDAVAEAALRNPLLAFNPRPIGTLAVARDLLQSAF